MARPDLNSFINRKVSDTPSLVKQIKTDPVVADRYQRHFGMTRQEVVAYVSNLHRGALPEAGEYTVYSVPDDGHVKMHTEKLKKGEAMFMDPSNRPILIAKCGNPVVMGPSDVRKGNPMALVPTGDSSTREFAELTPRDAVAEGEAPLVALVPAVPEIVAPPVIPPVAAAPMTMVPVTATGGGGGGFNGLPLLGALPLLFLGGGHGGGGGTQAVPEPATMVALGLGAVAVIRRRRRA